MDLTVSITCHVVSRGIYTVSFVIYSSLKSRPGVFLTISPEAVVTNTVVAVQKGLLPVYQGNTTE